MFRNGGGGGANKSTITTIIFSPPLFSSPTTTLHRPPKQHSFLLLLLKPSFHHSSSAVTSTPHNPPHQMFVPFTNPSDIALCNSKLKSLSHDNQHQSVLSFYRRMRSAGLHPDGFTLPLVINSFTHHHHLHEPPSPEGLLLHSLSLKLGALSNPYVTTSLVAMYSTAMNSISSAHALFSSSPFNDLVLSTTMASAYAAAGDIASSIDLFSSIPNKDSIAWNSMLLALAQNQQMPSCQQLFHTIPNPNIFSWNILITGYSRLGQSREVLSCFRRMVKQCPEVEADEGTMAGVLSACGRTGSLGSGRRAHAYVEKRGLRSRVYIGNALVDMYGRCGEMRKGMEVFRRMGRGGRDVVSWNSAIKGLAENGEGRGVMGVLAGMKKEGVEEDEVTMVGVLWACGHMGMVREGVECVKRMRGAVGVAHYGCVVDMLARAGMVEEAAGVARGVRGGGDEVMWTAVMGGLSSGREGEEVGRRRLVGGGDGGGKYVMLAKMYGGEGRWGEMARVRVEGRDGGVKKKAGWSCVEVEEDGVVVEFLSWDGRHHMCDAIYGALVGLCRVSTLGGWIGWERMGVAQMCEAWK